VASAVGPSLVLQFIGICLSGALAAGVAYFGYRLNRRAAQESLARVEEAQERRDVAQKVEAVAIQAKEAATLVKGVALQAREAAELVRGVALTTAASAEHTTAQLTALKEVADSAAALGVSTHKLVNSNLNEQKRLVVEGLEREATYLSALTKLLPQDEELKRNAVIALQAAHGARKEFEANEILLARRGISVHEQEHGRDS
jgi:hypothetical protein